MGKLNMGVLGGFSGTVGTVIGSITRKGDDLIRVKSKIRRTSNTVGQMDQRSRFGLVLRLMRTLNILLKIGFKLFASDQMSSFNYASRKAMAQAIIGTYPDYEIDYSKLVISEGLLAQVTSVTYEMMDGMINFHWIGNLIGNSHPTDKMVLVIYNSTNRQLSYTIGVTTRVTKGGILPIPNSAIGDKLVLYLFLQSADDEQVVSTSQYVGTIEVTE